MLDLPDYLRPLERFQLGFPSPTVAEVLARGEAAVPDLVDGLNQIIDQAPTVPNDVIFHEFALRLLAHMRDPAGFDSALRLARSPEADRLLDDTVTEQLPGILAAMAGAERWRDLAALIEDREADPFARSSGLGALGVLHCEGLLSREDLNAYAGQLFAGRLEREPSFVWDGLIALCSDFQLTDHLDAIRAAYIDGRADPSVEAVDRVEARLNRVASPEPHLGFWRYRLYDEGATDMTAWPGFSEDAEEDPEFPLELDTPDLLFDRTASASPHPTVRSTPKIGRNDACPCGSEKKFKKCCGA